MDLVTKRLTLVPVNLSFDKDIFDNFTSEVTTYMLPSPANQIEETREVIAMFIKQKIEKTDYVFAITVTETSEFIGLVGIHNLKADIPNLGIWTKISSHGNHYGREAIGEIIELAKTLNIKKILYPVDKRNIPSKKIPQYYNGKLIVKHKEVPTFDGRILQEEVYEINLS